MVDANDERRRADDYRWTEVHRRLSAIEERIDQRLLTKEVYQSDQKSWTQAIDTLARAVTALEDSKKWILRTIGTVVITQLGVFTALLLTRGNG